MRADVVVVGASLTGLSCACAGLTLADDYTRQQYLATMEGAVVTGKLAATSLKQPASQVTSRPWLVRSSDKCLCKMYSPGYAASQQGRRQVTV